MVNKNVVRFTFYNFCFREVKLDSKKKERRKEEKKKKEEELEETTDEELLPDAQGEFT